MRGANILMSANNNFIYILCMPNNERIEEALLILKVEDIEYIIPPTYYLIIYITSFIIRSKVLYII